MLVPELPNNPVPPPPPNAGFAAVDPKSPVPAGLLAVLPKSPVPAGFDVAPKAGVLEPPPANSPPEGFKLEVVVELAAPNSPVEAGFDPKD